MEMTNLPFFSQKNILRSKTIWGAIIAFVPAALEITNSIMATGVLPPKAAAVVSGVGAVLAFVGRLAAKEKLTVVPEA